MATAEATCAAISAGVQPVSSPRAENPSVWNIEERKSSTRQNLAGSWIPASIAGRIPRTKQGRGFVLQSSWRSAKLAAAAGRLAWRFLRSTIMELREALAQISVIRDQIARTETFDGYRSVTVASTRRHGDRRGGRSIRLDCRSGRRDRTLPRFVDRDRRCRRAGDRDRDGDSLSSGASQTSLRLTRMVVEQFLPCLVVGRS